MHVNKKIIYVSHDAHFHGAQLLSLHTIKTLKENFHYSVQLFLWNNFNSRFQNCIMLFIAYYSFSQLMDIKVKSTSASQI